MNARTSADWRRPSGTRKERDRILVVTEGEVTEPQYFKGLAKYFKATGVQVCGLRVAPDGRGDPLKVIQRADDESDNGHLIGKRDGYTSVWCVVDVDTHANLTMAISAAKKRKYNIVVSNPCFEIWLIWHYKDYSRHSTSAQATKESCECGILKKQLPRNFPYCNVSDAIRRSGCPGDHVPKNPGSGVWELAKKIAQI